MAERHHISGIEISRGIAAIFVILFHVSRHIDEAYKTPLLANALQFGHAGVDLFFVISGFIILYVHYDDIGNPGRFARYVWRRLTRILPAYWVALALTIVMQMFHHNLPSMAELLWSAFLLPSDSPMILGIAWTLQFEMLFYVMFGLIILNRWVGLSLMASWLIIVIFCAVSGIKLDFLPQQFQSAFVFEFFFGMAVAYIIKQQNIRKPYMLLSAGLLLFITSGIFEILNLLDGFGNLARIAYGVSSAFLILGIVALPRAHAISGTSILRIFGAASYSLYIFQFVFIGAMWQFLTLSGGAALFNPLAQFIILSCASIIGGVLASRLIEQPLIRFCRALTSPTANGQFA